MTVTITHDQKTKIKIAMANRRSPERIAADLGLTLEAIKPVLRQFKTRGALRVMASDRDNMPSYLALKRRNGLGRTHLKATR